MVDDESAPEPIRPAPAHRDEEAPATASPVPFLVAFIGFVIVAVAAFVFLREDRGTLAAPDAIRVTGPNTLEVAVRGPFDGDAVTIRQVGYALGEERISIEVVLDAEECADGAGDCTEPEVVVAEVVLPEDVAGREVVAGTGRALLDCRPAASSGRFSCR